MGGRPGLQLSQALHWGGGGGSLTEGQDPGDWGSACLHQRAQRSFSPFPAEYGKEYGRDVPGDLLGSGPGEV